MIVVNGNEVLTLEWIDKGILKSDAVYQRELNVQRIKKMSGAFDILLCSALLAGQRSDGGIWVVDGQHRLEAARLREDIDVLPMCVFKSKGRKHEANVFVRVNLDRSRLSPVQVFTAALCAGEEESVEINNLIESYGFRVHKGSWPNIAAASALRAIHRKKNLNWVMDCLVGFKDHPANMRRAALTNTMLHMVAECALMYGPEIDEIRFCKKLYGLNYVSWKSLEARSSGAQGSRGKRLAREFIDEYYNANMRKNRIDTRIDI